MKWIDINEELPPINNDTNIVVWTNYGLRLALNKDSGLQIFGMGKESQYKDMFTVTHWMFIESPSNYNK